MSSRVYGATVSEFKSALEQNREYDLLDMVEDEFGAVLYDPELMVFTRFEESDTGNDTLSAFDLYGAGMVVTVALVNGREWVVDARADEATTECECCGGTGWYDSGNAESGPMMRRCGCGAGC